MPRDQETGLRNDPATRDDPLFRDRSGPARPDQDEYGTTGSTPIGDDLAATRGDGSADADVTDAPGEWVAGSKGPDYAPSDDATDPATTGTRADADLAATDPTATDPTATDPTATDPAATDPLGADQAGPGATPDLRTTRDPEVAPDAALSADPGAPQDPDAPRAADSIWGPSATQGTDAARDADLTGDTEVTTDPEATPPGGLPVQTPADAPPAGATASDVPADADLAAASTTAPATTPADAATTPTGTAASATTDPSAATPGTPVPGAPGTAPTTGVDAAVAAFVTNGDELHAEWVRIQSSFVDDPRGSVSQAADLVSQVTSSLITAVQEREQAMRGTWDAQGGDADTEHLRNAFRDYRAFFERLAQL